jgi:DHA2 family multidrug resistance protein
VVVVAGSLWWLGQFSLEVDFRTIVHVRMLQGLGLAFLFVPINTIAYARVAAAARNSASSLVNIARNIGGSVGISVATALIVRGTQAHRAMLSAHTTPYDPEFVAASQRLAALAATAGGDPVRADAVAAGVLSQTLDRQAAMLAYIDVFRLLAVTFLLLVPVVLLMRRRPPARHVELAIE